MEDSPHLRCFVYHTHELYVSSKGLHLRLCGSGNDIPPPVTWPNNKMEAHFVSSIDPDEFDIELEFPKLKGFEAYFRFGRHT